MHKLMIAIDLGASLTKCFYSWSVDGVLATTGYRTFCSAAQRITPTHYALRTYADNSTSLVHFEDEYWGVGENAREAVTNTNLRMPKSRHAIAKVLGLIGQIVREYVDLSSGTELHIDLGVLLPLSEMLNARELSDRLAKLLYGFGHNADPLCFTVVDQVRISPEGYGIRQMAKCYPCVVIMLGHKDFTLTCTKSESESISLSDSRALQGWGMLKLVRQISYPFNDELSAAAAIYAAGDELLDKQLLKVVLPEDLARVKAELPEARALVWAQLWDELRESTIETAEQVFAAGGNAIFWRPELKRALGSRLSMGGELINEIRVRFPKLDRSPLLYRLSDCYGFFKSMELDGSYTPAELKIVKGGSKK